MRYKVGWDARNLDPMTSIRREAVADFMSNSRFDGFLSEFMTHLSRGDTLRAVEIWCDLVNAYHETPPGMAPRDPHVGMFCVTHAKRYWESTGDPLGASRMLQYVPVVSLSDPEFGKMFIEIAQEVGDEFEREQMWERVYPLEYPLTMRWKEPQRGGERTRPAVLVDSDENRALLRVGEWVQAPGSLEIVVRDAELEKVQMYKPGSYLQVTMDSDGKIISAIPQVVPDIVQDPVAMYHEINLRCQCGQNVSAMR